MFFIHFDFFLQLIQTKGRNRRKSVEYFLPSFRTYVWETDEVVWKLSTCSSTSWMWRKHKENLWKMMQISSLLYLHVHVNITFFIDRIMMLSVLKHTESKVKFWFLKNYLSPSFKVCDTNAQMNTSTCVGFGEFL